MQKALITFQLLLLMSGFTGSFIKIIINGSTPQDPNQAIIDYFDSLGFTVTQVQDLETFTLDFPDNGTTPWEYQQGVFFYGKLTINSIDSVQGDFPVFGPAVIEQNPTQISGANPQRVYEGMAFSRLGIIPAVYKIFRISNEGAAYAPMLESYGESQAYDLPTNQLQVTPFDGMGFELEGGNAAWQSSEWINGETFVVTYPDASTRQVTRAEIEAGFTYQGIAGSPGGNIAGYKFTRTAPTGDPLAISTIYLNFTLELSGYAQLPAEKAVFGTFYNQSSMFSKEGIVDALATTAWAFLTPLISQDLSRLSYSYDSGSGGTSSERSYVTLVYQYCTTDPNMEINLPQDPEGTGQNVRVGSQYGAVNVSFKGSRVLAQPKE